MNKYLASRIPLLFLFLGLFSLSCDKFEDDVIPASFQEFKLYPDEIYMFRNDIFQRLKLTPLVNDSLKTEVNITYSQPLYGQLSTDCYGEKELCYVPQKNFFGLDSLTYTVCSAKTCKTEKIRIHVEKNIDPNVCVTSVGADSLETTINTPKEIKLFANDIICFPSDYYGPIVIKPKNGTTRFYDYPGSYKNPTFIYYPNKDFVGEDSFAYRVYISNHPVGYEDMLVKIKVKAN